MLSRKTRKDSIPRFTNLILASCHTLNREGEVMFELVLIFISTFDGKMAGSTVINHEVVGLFDTKTQCERHADAYEGGTWRKFTLMGSNKDNERVQVQLMMKCMPAGQGPAVAKRPSK
ncbi:hypothetical protein CL654_02185 [bacterium]|nr:hypothetical protein [bacterium]